eukprot:1161146-Pelagomonas_calceolata.AAC.5
MEVWVQRLPGSCLAHETKRANRGKLGTSCPAAADCRVAGLHFSLSNPGPGSVEYHDLHARRPGLLCACPESRCLQLLNTTSPRISLRPPSSNAAIYVAILQGP